MRFTSDFYARIGGAFVLAWAGYQFSASYASSPPTSDQLWASGLLVLCGIALGLIITPYLTVRPLSRFLHHLHTMTFSEMIIRGIGLVAGLLIALLIVLPLSYLPHPFEQYLPIAAALVLGYIGLKSSMIWGDDIQHILRLTPDTTQSTRYQPILVDTSVIVDGRILNVIETGFIAGTLIVPQFVLHELQQLADSGDDLTRAKGKRGLDMLQALQKDERVTIKVEDLDVPPAEVDDKLIHLARDKQASLLTNDMNLQHIAQLQDVTVLNLNRLADALRIQFLVGDQMDIVIRSEGRERDQGIGYTDDGTMIVVEDARHMIGQTIPAVITRVYTTQNGRIVFAQLADNRIGIHTREH